MGTLVESTSETINNVAHKYVVTVRYHPSIGCTSDYLVQGPRTNLRE